MHTRSAHASTRFISRKYILHFSDSIHFIRICARTRALPASNQATATTMHDAATLCIIASDGCVWLCEFMRVKYLPSSIYIAVIVQRFFCFSPKTTFSPIIADFFPITIAARNFPLATYQIRHTASPLLPNTKRIMRPHRTSYSIRQKKNTHTRQDGGYGDGAYFFAHLRHTCKHRVHAGNSNLVLSHME